MRFAFHRDLALGRYVPLETPVHGLDPRTKLAAFVALLVVLFRPVGPLQGVVAGIVAAAAVLCRLPVRRIAGGLRALAWILALTVAYHALWAAPRHGGAAAGLAAGLVAAGQLVTMLLAAAVLTHATEPVRLADGLSQVFGFLERVRIPVRDLALVLTLALRFLPTVLEEAQRIVLAQRARGARFTGGPLERAGRLLPLAVPLFAGCLRRADRLALAMEARGFSSATRRTQLEPLRFRPADAWTLAATALLLGAGLGYAR